MPETDAGARRWSVYIVRCRDGSLYTGIATDVFRRIDEHRGGVAGARYLRGRAPLELVAHWPVGNRSLASRVEHRIKRMTRAEKELLVTAAGGLQPIVSRLQAGDRAE